MASTANNIGPFQTIFAVNWVGYSVRFTAQIGAGWHNFKAIGTIVGFPTIIIPIPSLTGGSINSPKITKRFLAHPEDTSSTSIWTGSNDDPVLAAFIVTTTLFRGSIVVATAPSALFDPSQDNGPPLIQRCKVTFTPIPAVEWSS